MWPENASESKQSQLIAVKQRITLDFTTEITSRYHHRRIVKIYWLRVAWTVIDREFKIVIDILSVASVFNEFQCFNAIKISLIFLQIAVFFSSNLRLWFFCLWFFFCSLNYKQCQGHTHSATAACYQAFSLFCWVCIVECRIRAKNRFAGLLCVHSQYFIVHSCCMLFCSFVFVFPLQLLLICFLSCTLCLVVVVAAAFHMYMQRVLATPFLWQSECTCVAHWDIQDSSSHWKSVANEWIHMIWAVNIYHIYISVISHFRSQPKKNKEWTGEKCDQMRKR